MQGLAIVLRYTWTSIFLNAYTRFHKVYLGFALSNQFVYTLDGVTFRGKLSRDYGFSFTWFGLLEIKKSVPKRKND